MGGGMTPGQRKRSAAVREAARESILGAALKVFTRRGYYGTTMADIAREARVSYGLAYHYFRSKDALFAELVRAAYEGSYGLFLRAKGAPGKPAERLRALVDGFLATGVGGDSALFFQVVVQALTLERVPKAVAALNARYLPLYAEVLEELLPADAGRRGTVTCFLALLMGLPIVLARLPGAVSPEAGTIMRLFGT
jgi:AcrR family transcriptional regulator